MKKILQLLPCLYFCLVSAWSLAQEPIIISFPEKEVQPNTEFCIDVQATNFTDITAIQFALEWNSELLNYQSVTVEAEEGITYLPNLNMERNFTINGNQLRFLWATTLSSDTPITFSEKGTLFQICFKAANEEGSASIQLSDAIVGEGVRASDLASIPVISEVGIIGISADIDTVDKVLFSIGSKEVVSEQNFCVPVTAKKLKDLVALGFEIIWNEDLLSFDQLKTTDDDILEIAVGDHYLFGEGFLKFAWVEFGNPSVIEVPDNLVLFELCFEAIGNPGNQAKIEFLDNSFEVSSMIDGSTVYIPVELENGIINITNEPIEEKSTLLVTDAIVEPDEEFCLPVLAQDMLPIAGLQFELVWDKEKLQYNSIKVEEDILGLDMQNASYSIGEDAFRLAWFEQNAQNISLETTQVLFELCFTALGTDGEQTLVNIGNNVTLEATTIMDNRPVIFDVEFSPGVVVFTNDVSNITYPGDTDFNQEVNHYDLINIGLGHGQIGPARENASLDYTPQPAEDWAASTPITNINYKHADTNGDGTIDAEDTKAIDLNWTAIPTLVNTAFTEEGIPFYVDTDTLRLMETNQLPIILGTEAKVAEKVYSIAFSIYYEAEVMIEKGMNVTLENSWLGTAEELISVQRFFPNEKRVDVAISRIDQQGMTGFGEIGALNIVMEDVILFQNEREVKFTIDHVKAIGAVQSEIMAISTKPGIAQVQQQSVATNNFLDQSILIYPNPASTEVTIAAKSINIKSIELRDVFGKRVSTIYRSNQMIVETLPTGIYFLTIYTETGNVTKKINIQ